MRPAKVACIGILAAWPSSVAQYLISYPADRSQCPSDDIGCIVGTLAQALVFPTRTVEEPYISTPAGTLVAEKDRSEWLLPDDFTFDYTGGLKPRAAEYVAPTTYDEVVGESSDGGITKPVVRRYYTGLDAIITINATGHFEPPHIGVQKGSRVTWILDTYEDASVESVHSGNSSFAAAQSESSGSAVLASNTSSFVLSSGRLNRNGGTARVNFTVRFGAYDTDVDVVGPARGLFQYRNEFAWDVEWRRVDGVPHSQELPRAEGSVLVSELVCSELTDCTACLLYVQCIWCAGARKWMRDVQSPSPPPSSASCSCARMSHLASREP